MSSLAGSRGNNKRMKRVLARRDLTAQRNLSARGEKPISHIGTQAKVEPIKRCIRCNGKGIIKGFELGAFDGFDYAGRQSPKVIDQACPDCQENK